jgi:vacuolar fusion protein MON1
MRRQVDEDNNSIGSDNDIAIQGATDLKGKNPSGQPQKIASKTNETLATDDRYIGHSSLTTHYSDSINSSLLDESDISSDLQARPTIAVSLAGVTGNDSEASSHTGTSGIIPSPNIGGRIQTDVAEMLSEVLNSSSLSSGLPIEQPETNKERRYEPWTRDLSWGEEDPERSDDSEEAIDGAIEEEEEEEMSGSLEKFLSHKKQYFVMSTAGKLVYSMHGNDELVSSYAGVLQAIVSFFETAEQKDSLNSFKAGNTTFVATIEEPLILVAVDKLGQSEQQLRSQLGVLYAQILSTLTKSQISKAFETRKNFDLRTLLGGTEVFLQALTREMSLGSPGILLGALECLKLRKSVREKINNLLMECRTSNLLYGMIVSNSRLVSVIRPRRHSLHPPDLYLVFSMLFNTTSFRDGGEHWTPICLPKFNASGFLYAYINFFTEDTALVLISPDKNAFFELREAKSKILGLLQSQNLIELIEQSVRRDRFKTLDIPVPLIRHFLYKSKAHVQFVMPTFETHYYEPEMKQKLMTLYHQLHGFIHAKRGQLRVYYTMRHSTTALAWITPSFEMYCVTGTTTKEAISQSVRAAVAWIKQNEERLFIVGGAVF